MNIECPFCSKINAIVWPQDESLPLILRSDGKPSERQAKIEHRIEKVAKLLLAGQVGVIPASRELSRLRYDVEPRIAEMLLTFVGIDSETDTLPLGDVRREWNRDALKRKDLEIASAEEFYRKSAVEAATELIHFLKAVRDSASIDRSPSEDASSSK